MERIDLLDRSHKLSSLQLLIDTNWMSELNVLQMEELAGFFQVYTAAPGTAIVTEGEPLNFFCLICEGNVDVVKENSGGRLKKLKSLGAGKVIGEMAFFDNSPSSTSIVVKSKCLLLIMDHSAFNALSLQSPHIAVKIMTNIIRTISVRLRETSGKLIDLL